MKKYIFIGASRVGKSNLILSIAKVLAELGKKVLIIDTTISQGIKSFFSFNFEIESRDPLKNLTPIVRENFSILFTDIASEKENKFDFTKLNKIDLQKYDYVFIEGDKDIDKTLINSTEKIYLLQDYDKDTLDKNKQILNKFKFELNKMQIVFVNKVSDICENMYFLSELIPCCKSFENGKLEERQEDIEINFSEQDYVNVLGNKIDGHIYLNYFSDEYKAALYWLVNTITEVTPKKFQKIVR